MQDNSEIGWKRDNFQAFYHLFFLKFTPKNEKNTHQNSHHYTHHNVCAPSTLVHILKGGLKEGNF